MRKILSVVLAVLMVSMIIPTMSFAATGYVISDGLGIAYSDTLGLASGETFKITLDADDTIAVNARVFDIIDETATTNEDKTVESVKATAGAEVKIQVKTPVPVALDSVIKIGEEKVTLKVRDRKLGDVNNDGSADILDVNTILLYAAKVEMADAVKETFRAFSGDVNFDKSTDIIDVNEILLYAAQIKTSQIGTYLGKEADANDFEDPFATPAAVELAAPTGLYAYHQNGTVYFTFDSVKGATGYTVQVGDGGEQTFTATSGSVTATYPEEGTLEITVVAKGDGTTTIDSKAATTNVVDATVSDELATWLSENGLSDVAITVYEITE